MRFMIIVRAQPDSEAGVMPSPEDGLMAEMAAFHEQLAQAGVLLDGSGLRPSRDGWRIRYDDRGSRTVVDGPFAEVKELMAGYTLIQVDSREAALEWSRRFPPPFRHACEIEVRQLYELEDFEDPAVERFRAIDAKLKT